jgi:glycerol kinase
MITATLESLAYQIADLVQVFEKEVGKLHLLKVDGGASQNNYLMQLQADLLGIAVRRPALLEATALGSAKLAGMNLNFWKNVKTFDRVKITKFKPNLSLSKRAELLSLWREAVKRVL